MCIGFWPEMRIIFASLSYSLRLDILNTNSPICWAEFWICLSILNHSTEHAPIINQYVLWLRLEKRKLRFIELVEADIFIFKLNKCILYNYLSSIKHNALAYVNGYLLQYWCAKNWQLLKIINDIFYYLVIYIGLKLWLMFKRSRLINIEIVF